MELKEIEQFEDKLRKMTIIEITDRNLNKELVKCYVLMGDLLGMIIKRYNNDYDLANKTSESMRKNSIKKVNMKRGLSK
jgi:hypothetical protein